MGEISMQTVTREDIEILQTHWSDRFKFGLKPSQFAMWLRMYPVDVCVEGFKVGLRWLQRNRANGGGEKTLDELIRYMSAVMRNLNEARKFDNE